ncbi:fibronectin type III domain-containing protein [Klenkia brasiliensis]|uniref:Fibronectin type III domain-containing protein n=1 Tax=Klenkia brasiliensis TaxID=333142 RepID=A0A1G7T9Y5_9ACTN|nr:fibronectin type III domain-containing protein [Klenkia brasiliensis]SDG31410.1 Fibronectin type III domain-containing protein [Klenkia brasiliensis]
MPAHRAHPPATTGRRPRWRRALLATTALVAAAVPAVVVAQSAKAAVPVFPDNIVVFPDRDMVSLEGFAAASGQRVTIEVRRGGVLVGQTFGTGASATAIAAGAPVVEVNHPGGVCWGAGGSTLSVTPDIRPGDVVTVAFGSVTADTTVQDAQVTGSSVSGTELTVTGHIGSGVDPAFLEQRIINPSMRDDPTIARRDVRAVTGPEVAAPKGSYSSGLSVTGTSFTAHYTFATDAAAQLAAEGALRAMTWQNQDADGNRQGLTIAEAGETGGPGMGGCPAGATGQGPRSPSAVTATQAGGDVDVRWTPAAQNPGTSPVLGWTVRLVSRQSAAGVVTETGVRIADPAATRVALPGELAGHRVEVRALSDAGESWPPALDGVTAPPGSTDATPPPVSASPAGGQVTGPVTVTLTTESTSLTGIYYTLDGTSPLDGPDTAAPTSTPYTGPITVSPTAGTPVVLRYVAIDAAGNSSLVKNETYTLTAPSAPGAPTIGTVTAGDGRATVNWTAPTSPGTSPVTGYTVTATPRTGTPVRGTAGPGATQLVLTGLTNGVVHDVVVTATNGVGTGPASAAAQVTPTRPATDTVTVTRASWKVGDLRVEGTGSVPGATVSIRSGGPTGPVLGTAVVGTPAAGAATGTWTFRLRTAAAGTRPADVYVTSSGGGQVGPVTLANA